MLAFLADVERSAGQHDRRSVDTAMSSSMTALLGGRVPQARTPLQRRIGFPPVRQDDMQCQICGVDIANGRTSRVAHALALR
jgi:hypothetical protein